VRARPALVDEHAAIAVLEDADEDVYLLAGALVTHRTAGPTPAARGTACISCRTRTGTARSGRPCAPRARTASPAPQTCARQPPTPPDAGSRPPPRRRPALAVSARRAARPAGAAAVRPGTAPPHA